MDRAERRQRRLEQKTWRGERGGRGRGRRGGFQTPEASNCESIDQPQRKCSNCGVGEGSTPMMRLGPGRLRSLCNACTLKWGQEARMGVCQNISEEESTDDVTVCEEGATLSTKDLQAQLHVSDASVTKWQKIAEERSEKNKELQTEIECLKLKIIEITEAKAVRHGSSELKLRAENQGLKDKNNELRRTLDDLFKHCSSQMEIHTQVLQDTKSNQQTSHHPASKGTWNAGRNGHESIAEANAGAGNQNNGQHQASKGTGNSDRNGNESAAEVNVVLEGQANNHPQVQTQHVGRSGSCSAPQTGTDGGLNKSHYVASKKSGTLEANGSDSKADIDIGGQSSEEDAGDGPNTPGGPEQATTYGNLGPSASPGEDLPEALFTISENKSALDLVGQEFLKWLNSRIRRPTAKEMSFHKSQLMERPWLLGKNSYYWTGIPGSVLLEKFEGDTGQEKPTATALTNLLRSVLKVAGSKRAGDMLWCLVWADCMNPEQLPGYALHPHDVKRARAAGPEDGIRSAKTRHP